jgi:hypothetical protein
MEGLGWEAGTVNRYASVMAAFAAYDLIFGL